MIGLRGQILVRLIGERHSTGNEALFVVKDGGLQRKWEDLDDFIGRGIFLRHHYYASNISTCKHEAEYET